MTRAENFSDDEVIRQLQGDKNADAIIRFLYSTHYEFLGRYITTNNGSWDDAQDLFQEVIVAFINIVKGGKFRGESSIKTFLYALNKNLWMNELKKRERTQVRESNYDKGVSKESDGVNWAIESRESSDELLKVMDALGENCKKILLLYYYENQSMKEIVAALPYENEQVVRNKKSKCLKQLEVMITANKNLYQKLKHFFHG